VLTKGPLPPDIKHELCLEKKFCKLISVCLEYGAIYSVLGMNSFFFLESSSYSLVLQTGRSMQCRRDIAAFKGNTESVNSSEMKIANSTVMTPVKVTQALK